ncbi:MAG: ribulokinase [Spirochaetae bacterium HGW-Spirochaetae-3]|nr:MAG: ribulokinase [Spirochaetae bacterium HGW-Spirochaetae-3]
MSANSPDSFVLGIDFGSDSVRALAVSAKDGRTVGSGVSEYRRWGEGRYCDPQSNRFRQHPLDYLESMEAAVVEALSEAGPAARGAVRALSVDTTGSTPCLADARGVPLALTPGFEDDPDAMFILWKDHTAIDQARRINEVAAGWGGQDFTVFEGGIYSAEWYWAKAIGAIESNTRVAAAAATIIEHCDWMPAVLTGAASARDIKRSRCAAGHKAMWHASWNGYPAPAFLERLHPGLSRLLGELGPETHTADEVAGAISPEWAARLGVPASAVVSVGAFDAHMGAVGGGVAPGTLVKIMGTSTCDITIGRKRPGEERLIPGICGQVDGSVARGYLGYEAGQSAFGDVFAWYRDILSWPLRAIAGYGGVAAGAGRPEASILPALEAAASAAAPGASGILALDWLNGRRTPDADQSLKGAITGLSLGSDAPGVYRALVEATAFGSKAIVDRFREGGVAIDRVSAIGGVASKSPLTMQILADVLDMEIILPEADQCVALGASMFAATAAGIYPDVFAAQEAMSPKTARTYKPDRGSAAVYSRLYEDYAALGGFIERKRT